MNTTFKRYWVWALMFAIAMLVPWLFFNWTTGRHSGFVLTMLSEIALVVIFALSFNMLMGHAGLLSFGHAVFFGLGGYCAAHAMNAIKAGSFWLPVELLPLVGGLGGLVFAILFGFLATQQRATAFAMITMGIGELVAAAALMFMTFFGGEGGITTNRMIGTSVLGVSYSTPAQLYYLILVWALICTILMFLQQATPLGRMANATRDNFERAQFVGYDPRMVRFYQFIVSGFFAGVAGSLYAMLYEIVTFDAVSAARSSTALLATYIGGVGGFFGPILGSIVVILMQSGISLLSSTWMLYVGVLFIVMVMYAPMGLWGIIMSHSPIQRSGRLSSLFVPYLRILIPGFFVVLGFVVLAELVSFTTIGASQNKQFKVGSLVIDPASAGPWIFGAAALVLGGLWLKYESTGFRKVWNGLMDDIKQQAAGNGARTMSAIALSLRDVRKRFGKTEIIRGVSLEIPKGQRHAIIGPNGAGKTTLFNLISGRFAVSSGDIQLNGESIVGVPPHLINRKGLSRSFQITSIFPRMTVFENIRCGLLWSHGLKYSTFKMLGKQTALNEAADKLLERLNLKSRRDLMAGTPDLCRAARTRSRRNHCGGRRSHPAR